MTKTSKKHQKRQKRNSSKGFHFGPLDWLCVAVGVIASIVTLFVDHDHSPAYLIASILALNSGIFETIYFINGRRASYLFAIINAVASIIIALFGQFYGNLAVNAYYIPLSIVGFYLWGKHSNKNKTVIARRLTPKQLLIFLSAFLILSVGLKITLEFIGGQSTFLDSITTIMIIFASIMGALRYREQWLAWIVINILLLLMFISVNNPAVLIMRVFFLVSSVYGYFNWRKLVKE